MKMYKENKILLIIVLLIGVTSIGYAILTTKLNITGTSKIKNAKWDVHFENIVVKDGSVTPVKAATIENNTTVSFNVDLTKPKEYYEFDVDVVNNGSIDAMIGSIKKEPVLTSAQQKYLTYEVKYSGLVDLHEKDSLSVGDKKTLNVFLKFREDITKDDLPKDLDTLTINYQIDYVQADKTAKSVDHNFTVDLDGGKTVKKYATDYLPNQEIVLAKPTKAEHKFTGWEVVSGDGRINNNKLTMGTQDTTIKAKWEALKVKYCTYNPEGGIKQGTKYVTDQYTYVYKQERNGWDTFQNIDEDGWSVMANSGISATEEVCTYINGKPVVSMAYMFYENNGLATDLSHFNTSQVTNMSHMFDWARGSKMDLSNFDTSKVTNMESMFYRSEIYDNIDLSNFDTSNVTNMKNMFNDCHASELNLSSFDTRNVTDMSHMFECSRAEELDLSSFNTSKVTNMESMFWTNRAKKIDLSSFDTSKVTNMSGMFGGDWPSNHIKKLDLSNFDTRNVTDMSNMFSECLDLTELDVSHFDTSKVTNMHNMFSRCLDLTELDVSGFDTSNVTDMSGMFFSGSVKNLDLSSFDTSNVTNMRGMFSYCYATTGYARNQTEADKFNDNSITGIYEFHFVVKPQP